MLACILCASAVTVLYQVNNAYLVEVPTTGGSLNEGIIGTPRFINPLLAISDADRDLTTLVYSGLMKAQPDGTLIPDLADSFTVSDNGLTYTFTLKKNVTFSDGSPITADDVLFTIAKAQDPLLKSPRRSNWDGVTATKQDDQTVVFTLKQPYSPFIQNATLGILPKHIWKNVDNDNFPFSTYNTKPIGSGPYHYSSMTIDNAGLATDYILAPFAHYILGKAYISEIHFHFYQSENELMLAYERGEVDAINSISPQSSVALKRTDGIKLSTPLPRVFGVFFNQSQQPVLLHAEVRKALDMTLDKQNLIDTVLSGFGNVLDGPLPTDKATTTVVTQDRIASAKAMLEKAGWKQNSSGIYEQKNTKTKITEILSISISTSDAPELKALAQQIQSQWQKIGVQVAVKIFEIGDLNQNIIRPRKYDALLFGEVIGRDRDMYPFWHSSERNDPGLNIALYTNSKVDTILENYRKTIDQALRQQLIDQFESEIHADTPAVFLYAPNFIYITQKDIKHADIGQITTANERFLGVNQWYIKTDKVWKLFAK